MPKLKSKTIQIVLIVGILVFGCIGFFAYASYKERESIQYDNSDLNGYDIIKKPAIYLYPLERTPVSVTLNVKGKITESDPPYEEGWNVVADPNGTIDGKYDYLFYEVQLMNPVVSEEGWVTRYDQLENWFASTLPKLGFNTKEATQFSEYWLKELPEAKYYEIKLVSDQYLQDKVNLIVSPKPDTIMRRIFSFRPLDEKIPLIAPRVETERNGFTLMEWGGYINR